MKPGTSRSLQLDVLRGIAVLLVFGRHLELPAPDGLAGVAAHVWFRIGWLGVDLFFVLSGFLIGGLLLSEHFKHGRIDVGRFLIRRGLKIYPAYLVFIGYLVCMPLLKAALRGDDPRPVLSEQWQLYWPNLLFLQNYVGTNPAGHTWTLAVEEHFYLLLPWALVALTAWGRMRALFQVCLVIAVVVLALRFWSVWTENRYAETMSATHLRIDALMFGVGLRAVAQYLPERFAMAGRWRALLVVTGLLLWSPNLFIDPDTAFIRTVGLTATYLGSAAFLVAAYHTHAAHFRGSWGRFAAAVAGLLGWVGVYSYAIYLWHVTAMGILEREVGGRLVAAGDVPSGLSWFVAAGMVCTGAVLIGVAASKLVEWPVIRLRDRWFPSRSGTLPAGTNAPSALGDPVPNGLGMAPRPE